MRRGDLAHNRSGWMVWHAGALVAALLAAGCLTPIADVADQEPEPPVPARSGIVYHGCQEHQGIFFAPEAPILAAMPDGFRPAVLAPGVVGWSLFTYECASVTGPWDGPVGPVREALAIFTVHPPDHLTSPTAQFHLFVLGMMSDNEDTAEVFRSWGVPEVHVGPLHFDILAAGPAHTGTGSGEAGSAAFQLSTTAAGESQPWQERTLRIFGLSGPLDPAAPPEVADMVDVTVHDRRTFPQGTSAYAFPGPSNPLARIVPAAGSGLGYHWEMEPGAAAFSYQHVGLPSSPVETEERDPET